jgi:hypothetical protein
MRVKKLIVVSLAALCVGAVAYAASPARRPATAVSRALAIRSQYNPFLLKRVAVVSQARATVAQRVSLAAVRPPYRPETRSAYQPPTRGPYLASAAQ